ncbi:hypothetical protein BC826DRAFT_1091681 [Russula brevipes]|nr:hypothetical protein BC826DRAFT_1091681 [Russula brevipes]
METQAGTRFPLSPSSTLVSPTAVQFDGDKSKLDHTRLTKNYPDAFTDTHGLRSGCPFVFKTGSPWPKVTGGPNFRRKLHPIGDHPIVSAWDQILTDTLAYLKGAGKTFNGVLPLGFGNVRQPRAFCPLVVTIGVEAKTIEFEAAKTVANHVKTNILAKAGFGDIDVAVWELEVSFSGAANLTSLDPDLDGPSVSAFRHPFASTLGLAIAPLKETKYEGTLGLFMSRGDGSELLGITAAHVARPPPMFPENRGLSAERHHEDFVVLGGESYRLAVKAVEKEIGNLLEGIEGEEKRIKDLQGRLDRGVDDTNGPGVIAKAIKGAQRSILIATGTIELLSGLHRRVTKLMSIADNRVIGHVLFADPIGVSSDGADGYTRDWAALKIAPDAFLDDFQGNKVYIGDKLDKKTFLARMFPDVADHDGYAYPEHGLLQLRGVVPESERIKFKHRNANGDPALGQLESLVRHYDHINHTGIDFWSRELTIVPHEDERRAFSEGGDSGAVIADRDGRIVAVLTGGSGPTNFTDVTFATPFCKLEKRIKDALPGARLLDTLEHQENPPGLTRRSAGLARADEPSLDQIIIIAR